MSDYNYDSFSPDNYNLQSADGPEVGQKAPDFSLETHTGEKRNLLDFEGECLVLELGSITCPLFLTRHESMKDIAKTYPMAAHAVLYVREAHPGAKIPAHTEMDEKKAVAGLLSSELDDPRDILVDGLLGEAHVAYGSMPNAIYIIDKEGIVRFKAPWNNSSTTRKALDAVLAGKPANFKSYFKPAKPQIVFSTVNRAGEGSKADFFRSLPILIWNVLIRNNIKTFLKK
ncbi:MAG: deiodinase-like protein [Pseudomonadota bacterium]